RLGEPSDALHDSCCGGRWRQDRRAAAGPRQVLLERNREERDRGGAAAAEFDARDCRFPEDGIAESVHGAVEEIRRITPFDAAARIDLLGDLPHAFRLED